MDLKFSFLFLFLLSSLAAFAQKDSMRTYQLSDVVISSTRTEIPLLHSSSSVTIIDSAEIINSGKVTVFDLLKDVSGISFTQQGGPGKLAYISIRGGNTNHTLLLIDGVEMNMTNDPSNTYDFFYLSPENISRIEILKGPQSTLYGSDAMAGVINIITRKGSGKPAFNISAEGGSYGTYKGAFGLNGEVSKINYSLTFSRFSTTGFSSASVDYGNTEKDGSSFNNFSSRIGMDITKDLSLNLFTRYSKGKSDYDQFGGKFGDDPTYVFDFEEMTTKLEGNYSLFEDLWQQSFGISFSRNIRKYSFDSTANNPASSNSHYDGNKYQLDWQNNFKLSSWNLFTFGLEAERELSSSEYFYNTDSYSYASVFGEHFANTVGIFLQDQLNFNESFIAAIGIRYDKHNKFGSAVTYRIAPAYIIKETGTKIRFSNGNAFKAPSIFNLFDPAYGNVNLKPEKNKAWDIGIEQFFLNGKYSAGLTFFRNDFTDLFGSDALFRAINIKKAESHGVEFYTTANITKKIQLKFNYTLTKANDLSDNKTTPLPRRPENKISFIANAELINGLNTMIEVLYVGSRKDIDFTNLIGNNLVTLKSYTLVNLSASYSILSCMDLLGRVDNLFNTKYEEIFGYGTPKFSVYAGFRVKL